MALRPESAALQHAFAPLLLSRTWYFLLCFSLSATVAAWCGGTFYAQLKGSTASHRSIFMVLGLHPQSASVLTQDAFGQPRQPTCKKLSKQAPDTFFDIHAKHELKPQNDDTGWGGMLSESKHRPKPGSCDTPDKQKPAAVQARCALAIDLSNIIGCHARVAASLAEQRLDARLLPKL